VRAKVPGRGLSMILKPAWVNPKTGAPNNSEKAPYRHADGQDRTPIRETADLPSTFTLDPSSLGAFQRRGLGPMMGCAPSRVPLAATRKRRAPIIATAREEQTALNFGMVRGKAFRNDAWREQNGIA
jgi:hypothetical protein